MTSTISERVDHTVLFIYLLTVLIKCPGLDFLKKSLLNNQYYFFFQTLEARSYIRDLRVGQVAHFLT